MKVILKKSHSKEVKTDALTGVEIIEFSEETTPNITNGYWTCCRCSEVNEKTSCWICGHEKCSDCWEDK